jgi:hypothetical protein
MHDVLRTHSCAASNERNGCGQPPERLDSRKTSDEPGQCQLEHERSFQHCENRGLVPAQDIQRVVGGLST